MDVILIPNLILILKCNITTYKDVEGNHVYLCNYFHKDYNVVMNRIRKGYSIQEAFEIPRKYLFLNKNYTYKGIAIKGLKNICKHFNKNYDKVYEMLLNLYEFEYVMGTITDPYKEK